MVSSRPNAQGAGVTWRRRPKLTACRGDIAQRGRWYNEGSGWGPQAGHIAPVAGADTPGEVAPAQQGRAAAFGNLRGSVGPRLELDLDVGAFLHVLMEVESADVDELVVALWFESDGHRIVTKDPATSARDHWLVHRLYTQPLSDLADVSSYPPAPP